MYKIFYSPRKGDTLIYHVDEYKIEHGVVTFKDKKRGNKEKTLPMSRCEIEEV